MPIGLDLTINSKYLLTVISASEMLLLETNEDKNNITPPNPQHLWLTDGDWSLTVSTSAWHLHNGATEETQITRTQSVADGC